MNNLDIQKLILNYSLSKDEQIYLSKILEEIGSTGESPSLNELWSQDYEEIPVSIEEFITNDRYLGKSLKTEDGTLTLYPYWVNSLSYMFNPKNEIMETALSGGIGLGKTTIAVVALCYILYKLLCLKNPAGYYRLNKGSKIAIAFFNINIDNAYGVGYAKMQSYLQQSPWFLEHGVIYGRVYKTYYPDKDIEILVGSKRDHFIGRDIFCLTGDTEVLTENGPIPIKDLTDNPKRVYNSKGLLSDNKVYSVLTTNTKELIEIQLDDNTIIKCTPNHKFMLIDGTFKEAQYLTENDELLEIN